MPAPQSTERFKQDRSATWITIFVKVAYVLTILTFATFAVSQILNT